MAFCIQAEAGSALSLLGLRPCLCSDVWVVVARQRHHLKEVEAHCTGRTEILAVRLIGAQLNIS